MKTCESVTASGMKPCVSLSHNNPQLFMNRELSWIEFNRRVLDQASSDATPLLERLKFLAILSSNVDEFYMKRLSCLHHRIAAGNDNRSIDGLSPAEQLNQCRMSLQRLQIEKEFVFREVRQELLNHDIEIAPYALLSDADKASLHDYYRESVQPLLTPWVVDLTHPFPFISNLSLNLLVSMKRTGDKANHFACIKVPTDHGLPRFVRVGSSFRFVLLEDIIAEHIGQLFPRAEIVSIDVFRVTRSAVSHRDYTELGNLKESIEVQLHDRKFASVIRLQVNPSMNPGLRHSLAVNLGLNHDKDVAESREILRMSDFRQLATLDIPTLRDEPHSPAISTALTYQDSIFNAIRRKISVVLQHPYESFTHSVEGFVREASQDPQVVSIKMTLYRTSPDTRIVDYLMRAADNGKQVTVVVELQARFDEAANVRWASQLESAGVHVIYGMVGLKTHCKCILVVKRDRDKIRRYAHIGTGNYHAGTAQLYSDFGLLTCDDELTADIGELFNYLTTACLPDRPFNQILAIPHVIKSALLSKIDREIAMHSNSSPGYICMKTNALEDPDIALALYRASQASVKVNLIVRDICRLRPGLIGVSENIRVISLVGRFLEHGRLYHFRNGGDEELYMGSADLMARNLERRVELLVPVKDAVSRQLLIGILNRNLQDNCCAWEMDAAGSYRRKESDNNAPPFNSQSRAIAAVPIRPAGVCLDIVRKITARNSGTAVAMPHRAF